MPVILCLLRIFYRACRAPDRACVWRFDFFFRRRQRWPMILRVAGTCERHACRVCMCSCVFLRGGVGTLFMSEQHILRQRRRNTRRTRIGCNSFWAINASVPWYFFLEAMTIARRGTYIFLSVHLKELCNYHDVFFSSSTSQNDDNANMGYHSKSSLCGGKVKRSIMCLSERVLLLQRFTRAQMEEHYISIHAEVIDQQNTRWKKKT